MLCCGVRTSKASIKDDSGSSSEDIDLGQDEGVNVSDRLWQRAYRDRLLKSKTTNLNELGDLLQGSTSVSLDVCQQAVTQRYKAQGFVQHASRIKGILDGVQPFTSAITALTQNNVFSSLVWGSILLLFQTALKFVSFFDRISRLLDRFSRMLPRFEAYLDLVPTPRLQSALRDIYTVYLDFIFSTAYLLKDSKYYLILKLRWATLESEYKNREEELGLLKREFDDEAALAHVQVGVSQRQEILSKLSDRMEGPLTTGLIARNPLFIGRQSVLLQLANHLEPGEGNTPLEPQPRRSCVVHGVGGLGKTQLALEYTYRYRNCYSHIFWLRAESEAILKDSFMEIGRRVGISGSNLGNAKLIDLIREWLEVSATKWLMVFDNVDDTKTILPFWPAGVHGSIIVTTQISDMATIASSSIDLATMTAEEGSELIRAILQRGASEKNAAEQLSKELGGHPLAIAHFAGYVVKSQCLLDDILVFLRKSKRSDRISSATNLSATGHYQRNLNTVWDLALDRLTPDARTLLYIISFLNPDSIPEDLFLISSQTDVAGEFQYWTKERLDDAVGVLRERHLVERSKTGDDAVLYTHRALQRHVLQTLDKDPELRQRIFQITLQIIRRAFPRQSILKRGDTSTWPASRKYLPHVLTLHATYVQSEPSITASILFAELLWDTGRFLFEWFWDPDAVPLLRTAKSICEKHFPSHKAEVEALLPSLLCGLGLYDQNDGILGRARARQYIAEAITMQEQFLEEKPPGEVQEADVVNLGRFYNDHGVTFLQDDIVDPSEPLFDKAIATYETVGGQASQGVRYGHTHNHRALALVAKGDIEGAHKFAKDGCQLIENILGPESSGYLFYAMPWAVILFNTGSQEEAFTLHKKVLELRRRTLGNISHDTLSSLYHVAVCEQFFGDLESAESKLRDIISHKVTTFQWRNEDLARATYRLSLVLAQQNRHREALEFERKAQELRQEWESLIPNDVGENLPLEEREMARYDYAVWIWHGRTAGKYATAKPRVSIEIVRASL